MKISKLFHWLYAILMLLPFLVFVPNAFYYGFNEHAVAQEKTEQVPVYYETNEVSSVNDLIQGNVYRLNLDELIHFDDLLILLDNCWVIDAVNPSIMSSVTVIETPHITNNGGDTAGISLFINNTGVNNRYYLRYTSIVDFVYKSSENISQIISYIESCSITYLKEYQSVTTSMSITDSMSYAWDSVWQNDLFSWSYGSFLTEPFIYIGNVFNVPVDNTLYYALSYWLDISIIWLCFDMVMYIPLLVHRWLDKGIID